MPSRFQRIEQFSKFAYANSRTEPPASTKWRKHNIFEQTQPLPWAHPPTNSRFPLSQTRRSLTVPSRRSFTARDLLKLEPTLSSGARYRRRRTRGSAPGTAPIRRVPNVRPRSGISSQRKLRSPLLCRRRLDGLGSSRGCAPASGGETSGWEGRGTGGWKGSQRKKCGWY